MSPDWSPLDRALAEAAGRGETVALWWRDDDAVAHTPALDRLLALAQRYGWPLALAAVPARMDASLEVRVAGERVALLVHGLAHGDHAATGAKRAEFGADRALPDLVADATRALALAQTGGALPVLVPPWNRIAPELVPHLAPLGYRGLSTFGPRVLAGTGIVQVNTHLDPIDWHGGRGLLDPDALARRLAVAVGARTGPVGLLTHHLVHDEATWGFLDALLARLGRSSATRAIGAADVFGLADGVFGPADLVPASER